MGHACCTQVLTNVEPACGAGCTFAYAKTLEVGNSPPTSALQGCDRGGRQGPASLFTSMTNCTTGRGGPSLEGGWGRRFHSYGCQAASRGRPEGTTCYRAVSVLSRMDRFVFVQSHDPPVRQWTTAYRSPSPHRIKSEPLVGPPPDQLECRRRKASLRRVRKELETRHPAHSRRVIPAPGFEQQPHYLVTVLCKIGRPPP